MGLKIIHKDTEIGVGDTIRVFQKIKEEGKDRAQSFEGILISIKNKEEGKTITVRRIGEGKIGIERIFPLKSPFLEKIEVVRKGTSRVRHAKLYFIRKKSPRQVAEIYTRTENSRKLSKP